jgi:hypothetical protein
MDKIEAKAILQREMEKYRSRSFKSLLELLDNLEAYSVSVPSGAFYQIEVQAMWDSKPGGNLRVMAAIDDGGFFSAFAPLTDSFIRSPAGDFQEEDRNGP